MKKDRVVSEVLGEEIALTPSDLYSKEFRSKVMGGYDKDEVEHFLERVADVFESIIKQNRDLRNRNEELRQELESYHEMESTLRNALVSSQKFHEDMLENARREADAMLEEAKLAKALAITKASKLPELLQQEINTLRAHRDALRTELHTFLQSHVDMLEQRQSAEEAELALARENAATAVKDSEATAEESTLGGPNHSDSANHGAPKDTTPPAPSLKPERSGSTEALARMLTRPMQFPNDDALDANRDDENPPATSENGMRDAEELTEYSDFQTEPDAPDTADEAEREDTPPR